MFKKAHDQMFRKAQMRLFSMIVSILLAVFLALVISINVITKAVMRGQSKEVLHQIAAGIEYTDKEFKFTPPANGLEVKVEKPTTTAKPTDPPATDESTTAEDVTTTGKPTTTAKPTETDPATEAEDNRDYDEPERYDDPSEDQQDQEQEQQRQEQQRQEQQRQEQQRQEQQRQEQQRQEQQRQEQQRQEQQRQEQQRQEQQRREQESTSSATNPNSDWNYWGAWGQNGDNNQNWGDGGQVWGAWGQNGDNNQNWGDGQYYGYGTYPPVNPWAVWPYVPWGQWNGGALKAYSDEYEKRNFDTEAYRREHGGEVNDIADEEADEDTAGEANEESDEPRLELTAYVDGTASQGLVLLSNRKDDNTRTVKSSEDPVPMSDQKIERIPKNFGSIDYFVIMADLNGKYLAKLYNEDLDADKAQDYINNILNKDRDTGMFHSYQFYQADKPNGTIMVFTDKSGEMDMLRQLRRTTIIIGGIAMIILSILAYFLSKKSIQPIKVAFYKQKQFVSDASHELKTPLTVISTNADVLSGEIGDNKWLDYIKAQTDRMSVLVNDLLNLTRLENNTEEPEHKYFNLSKAIENTALPFECQAFESNKKFEVKVDESIMLCSCEKHIKQMAAIFIDNALKYSNEGGTIRVSLQKMGDKKVLSIFNTGQGIKEEDTEKIFERFYRSDESRNRATGGYGLGLAIAKSIIDRNKFKLNVINQPGKSICFVITM